MIANVEIKRIDTLGVIHKRRWYSIIMLDIDNGELLAWETTTKPNYLEGETTKIIYSDRFAEQDILSDTRLITDVRRHKTRQSQTA